MAVRQMSGSFRTVVELMAATVQAHGDREAFVDGSERLSFGGWNRAADGVASLLADLGVRRGDVVCLVLPSSIDYAVCYQASMRLGAITTGINPRLGPSEASSILERTRPRVTLHQGGWVPPRAAGHLLGAVEARAAWGAGAPRRLPRLEPSDPVAIVWSSGTTGRPKGAVFDHENLRAVAGGTGDLSVPGDRRLSPLPFAHVGYMTRPWEELQNLVTTVVVPTPWRAGETLRLIEAEGVTVGQGVPTQWSLILAHPDLETTDVSSLRVVGTGATNVPPEMVGEMRARLGCPVIVGYASTETAIISRSRIGDSDEDVARTVGRPAEGVELEVVDDDGRPLAAGEVGNVRCRSRAAMGGYWDDAELTASVLDGGGWIATGDLGSLDERGYLSIAGRRGDMYIRGGYNVYPAEVEEVLRRHHLVEAAAVVGVDAEVLGQVGMAFVVPAEPVGEPGSLASELQDLVRSRLADYKVPERVIVVDELPLTAMSKVDKRALADMAADSGRKDPK